MKRIQWAVGYAILLAAAFAIVACGPALQQGRAQARPVTPERNCKMQQVETEKDSVWMIERTKTVNGVTVERKPVKREKKMEAAWKICREWLKNGSQEK